MPTALLSHYQPNASVVLIGMAAAGKTTIGRLVADLLHWPHVDTDHLIESFYGTRLQNIADSLTKEEFLNVEAEIIQVMRVNRVVISTGGSAVYRPAAMEHLATLGPIIHLDVPLDIILERIARNPDRGLAIAPGQTIEELFAEREALYKKWATTSVSADNSSPLLAAQAVVDLL